MIKRKARVDTTSCVACGCCIPACPKKAITIVHGMYAQVDSSICIGCGKCGRICPASVIEMEEE